MKNFYEATAIKSKLTSSIELMLTPVDKCVCVVLFNGKVVHDGLLDSYKSIVIKDHPVDSPIDIKIVVTRQHPEAIEVKVVVDSIEVIPLYQDSIAIPKTSYLNFNGKWNMYIPSFYPWLHEQTGQGWIA